MSSMLSSAAGCDSVIVTDPAAAVEAYLDEYVNQRSLPANLKEAVRYALLGGGKRLRPTLVIRSCEAVGGDGSAALAAAGAIEMIHCFSLVHDDLPAMDDDDLRRGRPTLHRHTDEATAILTGDVLMGLAFELIGSQMGHTDLSARVLHELAIATNNMIVGQVYDTLGGTDPAAEPIDQLRAIHRHKTGALIRCCGRMGAICGGADDQQLEAVTQYADAVGLMFQIVDDLLDVTQTTAQLGKAANKDADQGKLTYPGLLGTQHSQREVVELQEQAHQALAPFGEKAEKLHELCDYLAVRQK